MILIDPRSGSKELLPQFQRLNVPVSINTEEMLAGDFCFEGRGPGGKSILIGVERKSIRDMLTSMRSGRFSGQDGQVSKMLSMYDRQYLVLEGIFGYDANSGVLMEPRSKGWEAVSTGSIRYMYSELYKFIISLEEHSTFRVLYSSNPYMTAVNVVQVFHYWNDKDYDRHRSLGGMNRAPRIEIKPWSLARRWIAELKGIGPDSSGAVEKHFRLPGESNERVVTKLIEAGPKAWAEVLVPNGSAGGKAKFKRIGDKLAEQIVKEIKASL